MNLALPNAITNKLAKLKDVLGNSFTASNTTTANYANNANDANDANDANGANGANDANDAK